MQLYYSQNIPKATICDLEMASAVGFSCWKTQFHYYYGQSVDTCIICGKEFIHCNSWREILCGDEECTEKMKVVQEYLNNPQTEEELIKRVRWMVVEKAKYFTNGIIPAIKLVANFLKKRGKYVGLRECKEFVEGIKNEGGEI